jgi:AcrR family transcriptional regulator
MVERGAVRTSIDDVRRVAEVSGSQMSHYFQDKRSLVRAVIAWQAEATVASHHAALGRLDTFEALDAWAEFTIERYAATQCEHGCSYGSLAGELTDADPETRADLADGFERWQDLFRQGLRAMRDRGDLRSDADPAELALSMVAAVQGGSLLAHVQRDIRPLRAALAAVLGHIRSYRSGAVVAP